MQNSTPIEIVGWCRCLANRKCKKILYFTHEKTLVYCNLHWKALHPAYK